MLELIVAIGMFYVFGKMLIWGIKAAWSIAKIFWSIIFLPMVLVGMVLGGLMYIAFPILIIVGIVSLVKAK